ncbi:zinc finger protein 62 homolog [Ischnura elegans]|uniref:zinc finger protein 62 homolog n=1 Tax=Ischnura elegans TaxID=197161 RepID=UPI001ED88828|nr:zinc finger protein 62 homolog [Ischnura elegans]XP_046402041.1 zinc finger protein 62 homolog [Ischnura elegans]XP_046402049.1 zinc finger protein 62 homolog [Ischnura elegans]
MSRNNRPSCQVRDCLYQDEKKFFFPWSRERAEKWREACDNPCLSNLPFEEVYAKLVVCKRHFSQDMFADHNAEKLCPHAVPNIFLPVKNAGPIRKTGTENKTSQFESVAHLKNQEMNVFSSLEAFCEEAAKPGSSNAVIDSYYRYNLCRVCYHNKCEMINIFEKSSQYEFEISSTIEDVLQCKVSKTDIYPMFICQECLCELSVIKKFRDNYVERKLSFEEKLRALGLSGAKTDVQPKQEKNIDSLAVEDDLEATQDVGCMKDTGPVHTTKAHVIEKEPDEMNSTHEDDEEMSSSDFSKDSADEKDEDFPDLQSDDSEVPAVGEPPEGATRKNTDIVVDGIPLQRVFKCLECNEVFEFRNLLTKHIAEHRKTWPLSCQFCERRFKTLIDLNNHIIMHSDYKPYECEYCGLRIRTKTSLIRHKAVHTNEKPYLCSTCGISFRDSILLRNHMRMHLGIKVYKCEICDAQFTASNILHAHLRRHTKEKTHVCGQCKKSFMSKQRLASHILCVHDKIKAFQCDICSKFYSTRNNLNSHRKLHYKNAIPVKLNISPV